MPLFILAITVTVSLLLIKGFLLPFDWLSAFGLPTWLYWVGLLSLLSWCLKD